MKVLVTGGAGFVGSHLVEALLDRGDVVSVIDDFNDFYSPAIKRQNLLGSLAQVHEADIVDQSRVNTIVAEVKPECIVHLAGRAGVRPSVQFPELYIRTNVLGTYYLLEAARQHQVPKFVFASSSSVYGANRELPFHEAQPLTQTLSPYAATKLAGEHLCSNYSYLYGLGVVCLRFFTVYGPRQRPDLSIHKFTRLISEGLAVPLYGDGSAQRDFTYIDDILQGILAAIHYQQTPFEIFNLGESETIDMLSMIRALENALGKSAQIDFQPAMPGDIPRTYAAIDKARRLLNYQPTTSFSKGVRKFVDWFNALPK